MNSLLRLPIEDFDSGWTVQVIDVADRTDPANRQMSIVVRERQAANAADRMATLLRIPRVHERGFEFRQFFATRYFVDRNDKLRRYRHWFDSSATTLERLPNLSFNRHEKFESFFDKSEC